MAGMLFAANEDKLAKQYLTDYSRQRGAEGLRLGKALLESIEARTEVLFGLRRPEGHEMSRLSWPPSVSCLPRGGAR